MLKGDQALFKIPFVFRGELPLEMTFAFENRAVAVTGQA
jgi:hypothetical protein